MNRLFAGIHAAVKQGHRLSIVILLLVALLNFMLLNNLISYTQRLRSPVIYLAKERAMIIESGFWVNDLILNHNPAHQKTARQHLDHLYREISKWHSLLTHPVTASTHQELSIPQELRLIYKDRDLQVYVNVDQYLSHLKKLLKAPVGRLNLDNADYQWLYEQFRSGALVESLDVWIRRSADYTTDYLNAMWWLNFASLGLTVATLLFLLRFVFQPMFVRLEKTTQLIETTNEDLQRALEHQLLTQSTLYESENRFRLLATYAPVAIWLTNANSQCTYLSPFWSEYTGCAMDEQLGHQWAEHLHDADRDRCMAHFLEANGRQAPFEMDYRLRRHDGEFCWFQVVGKPMTDQQGQFTGYIGIAVEISNRKQYEAQLIALNQQLQAANQELKLFTTVASHDLQEPMRKVSAFTERLREASESSLSPEALNYLGRIEKSTYRMQTLIQALLKYSRLSTNPQPATPVPLDMVLSDVLSELELLIAETRANITVDGPLPVVQGNAIQIFQLFLNLIGNALKYHQPGQQTHVLITPVVQPPEGFTAREGFCIILIADNGIGFDVKYAERIFQPFQRVHDTSRYEGTGMGLAICQKIVDLHRGVIRVQSQPGVGSQFYVQLPLSPSVNLSTQL